MKKTGQPKTLQQAILYFADFEHCRAFLTDLRWPDGNVTCPSCGSDRVTWLAKQRRWKCYAKHAKPQFSLKTGTIFEDSPLGIDKWLVALWLIVNCKNGISSMEIARHLGITQKSAWFMAHRLRFALHAGSFDKLSGEVDGGMSRALLKLSSGSVHDYATIADDSPSPSRASRARRAVTSAGISLHPLTRRNPFAASSTPAATHRSTIVPPRQRFTLRFT